jgi:hypothetical protein
MIKNDDFKHFTKDLEQIEKSMKEMDANMQKASDINNGFQSTFVTPEAIYH